MTALAAEPEAASRPPRFTHAEWRWRTRSRAVPDGHVEFLRLTEPAAELAQRYLAERVLGPGMLADAEHIAMASVARVDVLVSWNFKHIVNLQRIHGYHDVNRRLGYPALEIRTPREVLGDE